MIEMIADMPLDDRPRERLRKHGAGTLSDSDLIAILLGSGRPGTSVVQLARDLVRGGLTKLAGSRQLEKTRGIGTVKAARLEAAFELGRRLASGVDEEAIDYDADILARTLMIRFTGFRQEHLGAVFLDTRQRILGEREIYVGTVNHAAVSTRDVLKMSLEADAVGVVMYHNHPSGDPTPSGEDVEFTKRMAQALEFASLKLIDHLVIGRNRYVSMKRKGAY